MKRLLITGATGFVGQWAMRLFAERPQWGHVPVALPELDLRDGAALHAAVAALRPDAVLHLAAQSFVPRSFADPRETFEINLLGTLNLLQALTTCGFAGRLLYVSSGDLYGRVPESELPVSLITRPHPRSPYAVSKLAAEELCQQWQRTEGLDVIVARPFNHIGPGQSEQFAVASFARQVAAIRRGERPAMIEAGDLDVTRDFLDVRDVVAAYAALLDRGDNGALYLIASGVERRVGDLLAVLCELAGVEIAVQRDPARLRPSEQRRMVADASALYAATGWQPQVALRQTLSDLLNES